MKSKVLKGGVSMALRQILSALLSLLNTLVVARILGPKQYGIVAISLGIFFFLTFVGKMGLNTYIVRKPDLAKREVEEILAFYNTVGVLLCFLIWLLAPVFGLWTGNSQVSTALRFLIPAIWFDMVGMVASSMLERDLKFGKISFIFALSEITNYALSLTLVIVYKNYLAAVSGYVLQFLVYAILAFFYNPVRWRLRWSFESLAPACRYGFSYSSSNSILNLRSLTIPLFVSRFAGIEAAAIVNVALRVSQKLLLLRAVIRNMSISVMAKLIGEPNSLNRALNKGMLYQSLLMGSICAAFSGFSAWVIPTMFGQEWILSAKIFPFVGLSIIVSALFDLQTSVLYASDHNGEVIKFSVVNIGLIWLSCLCFLPFFGVWGYCFAEMISLPSYYLVHRSLIKYFKVPNYKPTFLVILATLPPLFGGLWLSPLYNLLLMLLSYGILLAVSSPVRQALVDVLGDRLTSILKRSA